MPASCTHYFGGGRYAKNVTRTSESSGLHPMRSRESLNVDQTTVSKWENGESFPRVEKLLQIAALYDVSLDMIDLSKERPILRRA